MNFFIILCILLTHTESIRVSDPISKDGRNEESETYPNRRKSLSIKYVSLPTEKCSNISMDKENLEEEGCKDYCKELKKGFFDGECINGTCQCKFDITAIVPSLEEKIRKKSKTKNAKGRQAVKCQNLIRVRGQIGSENHKGCGIHCRLLSQDNKDGQCIDGICQCSKEMTEEKRIIEQMEDEEEDKMRDDNCRKDEECESECTTLNKEPSCMNGICRCRILPPPHQNPVEIPGIDREVKKCEHRRKAVSNEICRSHCEDFSRDHTEGRCVDGLCRCGYAVTEMTDTKPDEDADSHQSPFRNKNAEIIFSQDDEIPMRGNRRMKGRYKGKF